jgi:hypothetical protein
MDENNIIEGSIEETIPTNVEIKEDDKNIEDPLKNKNYPDENGNYPRKFYILFGIFFSTFLGLLGLSIAAGDDYWWHLKVGEWIVTNKQIPTTGIFSWYATENNLSWFAHEWLCEVFFYLWSKLFGASIGGILYIFLTTTLLGTILYIQNPKGYLKNLMFSCGWMVIGFLMVGTTATARPHLLTYSLFAILLIVCEKIRKDENFKGYLFFPLITIFWANWHGGSVNITYVVPIIYLCTSLFNFKYERLEGKRVKNWYRYIVLSLMDVLAICVNPRTYRLLLYPYSYTKSMTEGIGEWQPISFDNGIYVLICIMIICVILFFTKETLQFTDIAMMGAFMLMSLKYIRFISWLFIVTTFFIFKYIRELKDKSTYKFLQYEFGILGILFVMITIMGISNGTSYITSTNVEDEAVEILKTEEYERLYNFYDYGSFLIYNDIDVFIDGRTDMYDGHNLEQVGKVFKVYYRDYTCEDFINEFDFDMFMIPSKYLMYAYLDENPDKYEKLYEDDNVAIFKKIPTTETAQVE